MKIIIFGSSGNCGKYIVSKLTALGHEVHGIARSVQNFRNDKFHAYQGSICDSSLFEKLPKDADCVINLAGVQPSILKNSEQTNIEDTLNQYVQVNIVGVFYVLEFVRKNKIPRYIYTTSHRDVENHWGSNRRLRNDLHPAINYAGDHSMYAISKTSAKMIGDYYGEAFNIKTFNLRLPMIFLVPDSPFYLSHGKQKIMPFLKIIKDAMAGEQLEIWGDPNMTRDYVYIDNFWFLLKSCLAPEAQVGTYNVGTGEGVTTEQFIRAIKNVFDEVDRCDVVYKPSKRTYKNAVYDIEEERRLFDYRPILLDEMLRNMKVQLETRELVKKWRW